MGFANIYVRVFALPFFFRRWVARHLRTHNLSVTTLGHATSRTGCFPPPSQAISQASDLRSRWTAQIDHHGRLPRLLSLSRYAEMRGAEDTAEHKQGRPAPCSVCVKERGTRTHAHWSGGGGRGNCVDTLECDTCLPGSERGVTVRTYEGRRRVEHTWSARPATVMLARRQSQRWG